MVTSKLQGDRLLFLKHPLALVIKRLEIAAPLPPSIVFVTDKATTAPSPA